MGCPAPYVVLWGDAILLRACWHLCDQFELNIRGCCMPVLGFLGVNSFLTQLGFCNPIDSKVKTREIRPVKRLARLTFSS